MNDPVNGNSAVGSNPCLFMKLPKCMRQDTNKRVDTAVCQACIAGRAEGHLFEIKKKIVGTENNNPRN